MDGDESEAKWLAENVILPQYRALTKEMGKVKKCNIGMKLKIKDLEARDLMLQKEIHDLTKNINTLTKIFKLHIKDKKTHFTSNYTETAYERLKRKRKEYAALIMVAGTFGTTIVMVIEALYKAGVI